MSKSNRPPEAIKEFYRFFSDLQYKHDYYQIFEDYVTLASLNFMIGSTEERQQEMNDEKNHILNRYSDKEKPIFLSLMKCHFEAMSKEIIGPDDWFDFLGIVYEFVSGGGKKKAMGQFFTPPELCQMTALNLGLNKPFQSVHQPDPIKQFLQVQRHMKRIDNPFDRSIAVKVNDPCCGSGRMLLAAHCINPHKHIPYYLSAVDVDRICIKMTLLNFALHGCWGEVIWANTLSLEFKQAWYVKGPLITDLEEKNTVWYHQLSKPKNQATEEQNQFLNQRGSGIETKNQPAEPGQQLKLFI